MVSNQERVIMALVRYFCLFGNLYVVHQIDTLIAFIAVAYKFLLANINGPIIIFLQTRKKILFWTVWRNKFWRKTYFTIFKDYKLTLQLGRYINEAIGKESNNIFEIILRCAIYLICHFDLTIVTKIAFCCCCSLDYFCCAN